MTEGPPPELRALRERLATLHDLASAVRVLWWDQSVAMPAAGASVRADVLETLERLHHERLVDPELARLLDALEPWAQSQDPDSDAARLIARVRRDHRKAVAVPAELAAEMARAGVLGESAWLAARSAGDFGLLRDSLARHIELRHRYAACFPDAEHPYDVLLDDFEPGMTTARLRPLFSALSEGLTELVRVGSEPPRGPADEHLTIEQQRRVVRAALDAMGFDEDRFRLDDAPHPFCQSAGPGDHRITTRFREGDLQFSLWTALHEQGHALYEAGVSEDLGRTPLRDPVSLGIHESQSRLWENQVGRSQPFARWLARRLPELVPEVYAGEVDAEALFRSFNGVRPSLIRTEADEVTYNLHIELRFVLELALMEGTLSVDDLPEAFADGVEQRLGVRPRDDAEGVLQDIHWPAGLIGYFPTYTLGNLVSAQLWERAVRDLPDLDEEIERGDFTALREWLREHVHRHGAKFPPAELLRRVTGADLAVEPYLRYLEARLAASGAIPAAA